MNYFRGVQKKLAFDVRDFFTRERALGGQLHEDALIGPQYGKDDKGNLRSKINTGQAGPGGINVTGLKRDLDDQPRSEVEFDSNGKEIPVDPVSLKGYKYNKQFNPRLTSTCPCVPKFHSTFGRQTLYEDLSAEMERNNLGGKHEWRQDAKTKPAGVDRLIFREGKSSLETEITVLDEHGIAVVYREALNDLLLLEEEMMKIGSHYLNKAELDKHLGKREQPSTMLDRAQVCLQLFENELEFQLKKMVIIEDLLRAYEHVCDPLEAVRLI